MNTNTCFILLFFSISLINSIEFKKINIISLKENKTIQYDNINIKKKSIYSLTCIKVLDTFDFIGKDAMNIYKACEGKYDLLGKDNSIVQKDDPYCFNNLNAFFCKFHVKEKENKFNNTINSENLQVILTTIYGCINQNITNNNHTRSPYICPTLNNFTYKVENATQFCKDGMKPERFPEKNNTTTYDYAIVPIEMREECEKTVEVYNACIDSDNILFPKSNYMRCFNTKHAFYVNSRIEYLNKKERDLCSNFVLPSIAWKNLRDYQFNKVARFHCEGYELKTFYNYDLFTKEALTSEKNYTNVINLQKEKLEKSTVVITKTKKLSFLLKTIKKLFANFFPKFASIYLKKNKIPSDFFILFQNIKKNMDSLFEHSEKMLKLTRSVKYALAEYEQYYLWLIKLHENTEDLMKNILKDMTELYDNINPDPKTLALRKIFLDKDYLKFNYNHKDMASDQNEFVNMNINLNAFFNFTLKRAENNLSRFKAIENTYYNKLQTIKLIRKSIIKKKNQLKRLIVQDFN